MNRWKEASSLIVSAVCKKQVSPNYSGLKTKELNKCNFQILALSKRNISLTDKPQVCVFPGGTVSLADSVGEWEDLFSAFGLNLNVLSNSLAHSNILNLPIFNEKNEDIPRWLSLRITAIRETFEECGILLCKDRHLDSTRLTPTNNFSMSKTNHLDIDDIEVWRNKVLDDPFQFLRLCKECQCYPDVENLQFWSNWLTPSYLPDRFDAVFFLTNVDSLALFRGSPDYKEIAATQWCSPEEILELSDNEKIWLKPPQWFEIKTLLNINDASDLREHSLHRSKNCSRLMPIRIITLDGEVSLLPGDEMYPNKVDLFYASPIYRKNQTMASLRCPRMHRMEHEGLKTSLFDTR